ncbi:hypothetical protein [Bifidobacterium samirii]|uniref:Tight junction protein ZO-3 n=1 Tax=Bifidobacterium samirii TaxID=2306974 RepID=A0A430FUK1_9BIFI|nr:hypothetical protein [Bifidobacterium samirii]RSX56755.1 hypothetical protein D2E24_1045 [Bifidobacterium samirii]
MRDWTIESTIGLVTAIGAVVAAALLGALMGVLFPVSPATPSQTTSVETISTNGVSVPCLTVRDRSGRIDAIDCRWDNATHTGPTTGKEH